MTQTYDMTKWKYIENTQQKLSTCKHVIQHI